MILPKPFRKNKLLIYKNFSVWDFGLFVIELIAVILISLFISKNNVFKFITFFALLIPILILQVQIKKHDTRVYVIIWRWFTFKATNKRFGSFESKGKKKPKGLKIKNLNPFSEKYINENIIQTKSLKAGERNFVVGINIDGLDISTYNNEEKTKKFLQLQEFFNDLKNNVSIVKTTNFWNFNENIRYFNNERQRVQKTNYFEAFQSYGKSTQKIKENEYQYYYYLIIYDPNLESLLSTIQYVKNDLFNLNLIPRIIKQEQLRKLNNDIFMIPYKEKKSKKIEKIKFENFKFKINEEQFSSVQSISEFSLVMQPFWLEALFNTPSNVVFNISEMAREIAVAGINKAKINIKTNALGNKNLVKSKEHQYAYDAIEEMADKIAFGSEVLKQVDVVFINNSLTEKGLKTLEKMNITNTRKLNFILNPLAFLQFDGFMNANLKGTRNLKLEQEMPSEVLGGSWGFTKASLNDGKSNLLAKTIDNNLIIFDQFKKTDQRKNFNMFILGTSGSGKSTLTSKLVVNHLTHNRRIILIDPEREYKYLVAKFGGTWIEIGQGLKTTINPLQIMNISDDIENEINLTKKQKVNNHVVWLGQWFRILFNEFKEKHIRYLTKFLIRLYKNHLKQEAKIENLVNDQFPIISDLIELIKKQKEDDKEVLERQKLILEILEHNFEEQGIYQKLYNNFSNIDLNSQMIIFDVQNLYNSDSNATIRSALFTILSYIQNQIINNKKEINKQELVLIVDEAHLLIDPDNLITLNFLHRSVKRIRKYRGGIILTTQNPSDFITNEKTANKSTALIQNIQYAAFLNLKAADIEAVSGMFKHLGGLTQFEKKHLTVASKGQGIFVLSPFQRFSVKFFYNKYEQELFFKDKNDLTRNLEDLAYSENTEKIDVWYPWLTRLFLKLIGKNKEK